MRTSIKRPAADAPQAKESEFVIKTQSKDQPASFEMRRQFVEAKS